ncbi:Zn-ribbon containing protein [Halostagnicola sp. A-GB9-2]|uniref:OapC/ArvC family zinc-ribbon domain-containing protein n=1 Tax=Halostagnicola sp. A-GB9-2 TaxID=3048066 RepID=UPI0024BF4594|nr:Zn-ribbon containing protein [Halostagnicola sp. A-GB9-2]MDJ1432759.1 Zn-ribbon containing protein [Halostagnicola sp. A-GB9-2]
MPHQCTNCGRTFPDGSKEMLSGCPNCGGNKFQFAPSSTARGDASGVKPDDSSTPPDPPSKESADSVAARAAETVRDFVSTDTNPADRSESAGDVSEQSETGPETPQNGTEPQSTPSTESQPTTAENSSTQDTGGSPTQNAENSPTQGAGSSSATRDETDHGDGFEEPVQNRVSDWTTASDSDNVPSSSGEFPEWPDSARPPEDRSTADSDLEGNDSTDSTVTTGRNERRSSAPNDTPSGESLSSSTSSKSNRKTAGSATDRTGSRQAESEPANPEPTDSEPIDSEPTDPKRPESEGTDSVRAEPDRTGTERAETELTESEDTAQASARSDVVQSDELPDSTSPIEDATAPDHGRVVSEPTGEQPSLEDLRAELNEQFESIKILKPGQYELNLMELYNREEYIISLQEDGRYVIDVPDSWRDGNEE